MKWPADRRHRSSFTRRRAARLRHDRQVLVSEVEQQAVLRQRGTSGDCARRPPKGLACRELLRVLDDLVVGLVVDHQIGIERQHAMVQVLEIVGGDVAADGRVDDLDVHARIGLPQASPAAGAARYAWFDDTSAQNVVEAPRHAIRTVLRAASPG